MYDTEQISQARRAWVEEVSKMTPAEKDGAIQGVMDAGYALGLVVVPKERVVPVYARIPSRGPATMTLEEMKQRRALEAAMTLGQEIVAGELAEMRGVTHISGQRETQFRVLVVKPAPEPVKPGETSAISFA